MAWERLHVLARNPIPPASSDNSLSASFPPSRRLRSRHSYPGGPILGLDLPPFYSEPPPPFGEETDVPLAVLQRSGSDSGFHSLYTKVVAFSFSIDVVCRLRWVARSSAARRLLAILVVCTAPIRLSPPFGRRHLPTVRLEPPLPPPNLLNTKLSVAGARCVDFNAFDNRIGSSGRLTRARRSPRLIIY